ncbi:hypothetical protein ES703_45954 [subsurface metagenome]
MNKAMNIKQRRKSTFWIYNSGFICFTGLINLFFEHPRFVKRYVIAFFANRGFPEIESIFLASVLSGIIGGISLIAVLFAIVKIEKPVTIRSLFSLYQFDWRGLCFYFIALGAFNLIEHLILRKYLFNPVESLLLSLGFPQRPAYSFDPVLLQFKWLNSMAIISMCWIEFPEELYFRGYFQKEIYKRFGAFWSIILSAFIWDIWHFFGLAMILRRFFVGLITAVIFHWRNNVWGVAVGHPLGNRLLVLLLIILRRKIF